MWQRSVGSVPSLSRQPLLEEMIIPRRQGGINVIGSFARRRATCPTPHRRQFSLALSLLANRASDSNLDDLKPLTAKNKMNRAHIYRSLLSSPPLVGECDSDGSSNTLSPVLLMDYVRGWAWQQVLLNRRLHLRRPKNAHNKKSTTNDSLSSLDPASSSSLSRFAPEEETSCEDPFAWEANNDPDVVLLLEHNHVYTLGRGADENHLTFLAEPRGRCSSTNHAEEARRRLARTSRGAGSARLSLDRRMVLSWATTSEENQAVEMVERICGEIVPVVAPNGVPIYRVERGGECTYHGPGQLVVYPLLDLKRQPGKGADLHDYLRRIEEVVILTLRHYGIRGSRDASHTGVWVGPHKVAAVGVSSSRWITTHGFALNVRPDLTYFDTSVILPCGIDGRGVTSIAEILRYRGEPAPTVSEVSRVVLENLAGEFHLNIELIRDIYPAQKKGVRDILSADRHDR